MAVALTKEEVEYVNGLGVSLSTNELSEENDEDVIFDILNAVGDRDVFLGNDALEGDTEDHSAEIRLMNSIREKLEWT